MATLTLKGATPPEDAKVPGSLVRWVALFEQLFSIEGAEDLSGVIIQETAPDPADSGKPWLKISGTGVPLGWYAFASGAWTPLPFVVPTVETLPVTPQANQTVWHEGALKIYRDGAWTTNSFERGSTEDRPASPPVDYIYFDTTINRLLRYASAGSWTTLDGCLGEGKILLGVSEEEAETRNPGWSAYALAGDKFLRVAGTETGVGDTGGREEFKWSATRQNVDSGGGAVVLDNVRIDGQYDKSAAKPSDSENVFGEEFSVNTVPPFLGVILIRKEVH